MTSEEANLIAMNQMSLPDIIKFAVNKEKYTQLNFYIEFTKAFLNFISAHLQVVIVSQNENLKIEI